MCCTESQWPSMSLPIEIFGTHTLFGPAILLYSWTVAQSLYTCTHTLSNNWTVHIQICLIQWDRNTEINFNFMKALTIVPCLGLKMVDRWTSQWTNTRIETTSLLELLITSYNQNILADPSHAWFPIKYKVCCNLIIHWNNTFSNYCMWPSQNWLNVFENSDITLDLLSN